MKTQSEKLELLVSVSPVRFYGIFIFLGVSIFLGYNVYLEDNPVWLDLLGYLLLGGSPLLMSYWAFQFIQNTPDSMVFSSDEIELYKKDKLMAKVNWEDVIQLHKKKGDANSERIVFSFLNDKSVEKEFLIYRRSQEENFGQFWILAEKAKEWPRTGKLILSTVENE